MTPIIIRSYDDTPVPADTFDVTDRSYHELHFQPIAEISAAKHILDLMVTRTDFDVRYPKT